MSPILFSVILLYHKVLLLIESGASRSSWLIIHENKQTLFLPETIGLNPFHTDQKTIETIFQTQSKIYNIPIYETYFYGAGYKDKEDINFIIKLSEKYFQSQKAFIYSDIMAVVHAFGIENGLGIILGTGANACQVVHGKIEKQMRCSGFLLGDEGSASDLAKKIMKDYIEGLLPSDLENKLQNQYHLTFKKCLSFFYNGKPDKVKIAHYAYFIGENINHDYIKNLVLESFKMFLNQLKKQGFNLKSQPIYGTGSILFHFQAFFSKVLKKESSTLFKVSKNPTQGLLEYYLKDRVKK